MTRIAPLIAALASLTFFAGPILADPIVIFNDTFADGGRGGSPSATSIPWAAVNTVTSIGIVTDNTTPLSGNALSVVPSGTDFVFDGTYGIFNTSTAAGSGVALGTDTGDRLVAQFDFRWTASNTITNGREVRFGLYNNSGSNSTADNNGAFANDTGYRFSLLQTGGTGSLLRETGGNATIGSGSDTTNVTSTTAGTAASAMGTTGHTFLYTLTRRSDGGIDLSAAMDGTVFRTGTDAANINSFHGIYIGTGRANTGAFRIDNVSLSVVPIPEPASLALMGLGGLLMLSRGNSRGGRENA